ncbi:MAG: hypothetical protein CM15mP71_2010 [Candidatus Poseidoniales archaeon]|nr:MAG: hypothetical protein CM15mP71_2010 [Candidatus Poseidoniales archaeon]
MESQVIDDAYLQCQQICKNASTTFYSSFSALGWEKRRAVHAVYALCRWVDDIVDGDEEPTVNISDELTEQTIQRDLILGNCTQAANHLTRMRSILRDSWPWFQLETSYIRQKKVTSQQMTNLYLSHFKMFSPNFQSGFRTLRQ